MWPSLVGETAWNTAEGRGVSIRPPTPKSVMGGHSTYGTYALGKGCSLT